MTFTLSVLIRRTRRKIKFNLSIPSRRTKVENEIQSLQTKKGEKKGK